MPTARNRMVPGGPIGQNSPGRSAFGDIRIWYDRVHDWRAVLDQRHVRIVAAMVQGQCRVFGDYADIAPEPRLGLHSQSLSAGTFQREGMERGPDPSFRAAEGHLPFWDDSVPAGQTCRLCAGRGQGAVGELAVELCSPCAPLDPGREEEQRLVDRAGLVRVAQD